MLNFKGVNNVIFPFNWHFHIIFDGQGTLYEHMPGTFPFDIKCLMISLVSYSLEV